MFNKLAAISSLAVLAVATPAPNAVPASSCDTGALQCCDSTSSTVTPAISKLFGLLGISAQGVAIPIGITCSPISVRELSLSKSHSLLTTIHHRSLVSEATPALPHQSAALITASVSDNNEFVMCLSTKPTLCRGSRRSWLHSRRLELVRWSDSTYLSASSSDEGRRGVYFSRFGQDSCCVVLVTILL